MKSGTISTTWTPAPEDGEQATAKAQLTADQAHTEISNYKTDADGRISKAQSDITQTAKDVTTKVSQTDYNAKTSELTTNVNKVTQTADQSKQDIVAINQKDGDQDARMNTIESDASGTKQTVSNIQTKQGQQDTSITTLQTRADGIETNVSQSISKINDLYQKNLIINTEYSPDITGWYLGKDFQNIDGSLYTLNNMNGSNRVLQLKPAFQGFLVSQKISISGMSKLSLGLEVSQSSNKNQSKGMTFYDSSGNATNLDLGVFSPTTSNQRFVSESISVPSGSVFANLWIYINSGGYVNVSKVILVNGETVGSYVEGNYNNDSKVAKAQLTADQATTSLANYKTDADGRISKAQSDIVQTAKDVTTKVSQSDYNSKTSELTTDVSTAQQTADSAVTTIGSYKTSNDNRVSSAESKISQNANDITLRATKTDLDAAKTDYTSKISQINVNYDGISQTVSQVSDKVNDLSQNNLINNSDFVPDLDGWYLTGNGSYSTGDYDYSGAVLVVANTGGGIVNLYSTAVPLNGAQSMTLSWSFNYYIFSVGTGGSSYIYMQYLDSNRNPLPDIYIAARDVSGNSGGWNQHVINNFVLVNIPSNAKYIRLVVDARNLGTKIGINRPMLVKSTKVGSYVSGRYNSNGKVASQQITIDGITNIVSDPTTGLSTRVQTAEGTLNTVKSTADGAMSKASQTANDITQEISDRKTGDNNTLQSAKDFTQSSITSSETGMKSIISQTASGILAQVESTNMVVNSEFDPLDGTWYQMSNGGSTGSAVGGAWNAPQAGSFQDWPVINGSRIITYSSGSWFTSTLMVASAGKSFSASVVAGRSPAPTVSTALDFRIGFWDSNRTLIGTASAGNIIDGTSYKGVQKYVVENRIAPANTKFVSVIIAHSSANAIDYISRPSLNIGSTASPYVPTYGTNASSTVLSLLKDNWSIGISDNIGNITSGIVGNSNSMSVISDNITLKGTTTVTGEFFARGGSFTNLNASNMTAGTLNASLVNVTNLNASNIVTGTITGASLMINLTSGQVQFQKGRIFKSDYTTDINIDQGYISTADGDTRVLLKGGQMQFVAPNVFDLQNTPYLKVYNGTGGSSFAGANLSGRDYIALYNSANSSNVFDAPIGTESFSGISTGKASTGKWAPTKVGGADRGVIISGGNTDGWLIVERSPYIFVGSDANGTSAYGNRVYVHADYFHVPTVWSHGGSTGANVYVASDGAILKSSSATKYKTNIEHEIDSIQGDQLLTIDPATWNDKFEAEQLERYHETGVEPERKINMEGKRYYGIIAEDLVKAGLEELVARNEETNEVEGVEYSKIGVALIPIIRDLRNKLNEQAVEIERLKDKNK
ncbi:MAG: gp58-like family protein [Leuconostoc mesenteroides]